MDLDDLVGSMHRDKVAVLEAGLRDIDEKLHRRHEAGKSLIKKLEEQLADLTQQRLHLLPEGGMFDSNRRERQTLEREIRDREITLEMEKQQLGRDVSFLEQERRKLAQYAMEEAQRQDWMSDFYET